MKKLFLLLTIGLSFLMMQAYTPLVREGVKWVYLYNDVTETPDLYPEWYDESDFDPNRLIYGNGLEYYSFEFQGDSLVNGKYYKKLYCSFEEGISIPIALLREDNRRVYALLCSDSEMLGKKYHFSPFLGGNFAQGETLLYDFANPQNMTGWISSEFVVNENTRLSGEMVTAYDIKGGELKDAKLVEGVGIDCYSVDLLSYPIRDDIFTCICPQRKGLIKVEDAQGNVIYKGSSFHADGTLPGDKTADGLIDVADVNSVIDVILQGQSYDPVADLNCDGLVDVTDVNLLIDRILGKK